MREHNAALRAARERLPSRVAPGEHMTRAELADAINAWLWEQTDRRFELDDHLIGKWERGVVRYPIREYRAALRAVLGVDTDDAPRSRTSTRTDLDASGASSRNGTARPPRLPPLRQSPTCASRQETCN